MVASFTAEEILYATSSQLKSGRIDGGPGRLVWELDKLEPNDWFVAIPSQELDPHDSLSAALDRGARGCIVNRRCRHASAPKHATLISVPDTKVALLDLVRYWRYKVRPRVVGVTGTSGRRAVIMLLHQLMQDKYRTHVAFMDNLGWFSCIEKVLEMPQETELLIFEAGAIERGDVARVGGALDPDLAVVTQIQHPLPSAERDTLTAALYCELLETLPESRQGQLAAVIYDENPAVKMRSEQVLGEVAARKYSSCEQDAKQIVSKTELLSLSQAMKAITGQPLSNADLWCALEAAKLLGLSQSETKTLFEPDDETEKCSLSSSKHDTTELREKN